MENIKKMIEIQHEIENPPEFIFDISEGSVDFILKNIFINYHKFLKFSDKTQMYV